MTKAKTELTALVDGDVFIFRAALAAERPIEWDDRIWTLHADMGEALRHFDNMMDIVLERTGASSIIVALSDRQNFRREILPSYKHNRKDKRPPLLRQPLKEIVQEKYRCYMRPLLEGDDVLGILATSETVTRGDKIVVSIDKDMKTLPCTYYNYDDDTSVTYTEDEADYNHLLQTLAGDAADGYAGCPGIGIKRAEKLFEGYWPEAGLDRNAAWRLIVGAFEKAGLDEGCALTQARVARICRYTDYDFKAGRPILWTPKGEKK